MAQDNESSPISEETLDEIKRNVLKGKTRKFVLIVKGGAIQTFVVFKKGAFAPKITAAKKSGFSGEATCGVISGQGTQAELQLAGSKAVAAALGLADGDVCEKEPCKPEKLRHFLKESADLKMQASFEIVQQADAVKGVSEQDESEGAEGEADDLPSPPTPPPTARGTGESEASEDEADDVSAQTPPKAPPSSDDATKLKLVEALKKLAPAVQQAIAAQPGRKDELLGSINAAKEAIAAGRLADATAGLKQLGALLQAPKAPTPPGGGASFDAKQWAAAKTQWLDAIETVDRQVSALQKALLKSGDGDLKEIAEFGLNGVTGNHKVPLMAAIRDVDGAAPEGRSKAAAQALSAARKFEDHINRDARVRACDAYAAEVFQVDLAIADTLGPALEKICEVLEPTVSA